MPKALYAYIAICGHWFGAAVTLKEWRMQKTWWQKLKTRKKLKLGKQIKLLQLTGPKNHIGTPPPYPLLYAAAFLLYLTLLPTIFQIDQKREQNVWNETQSETSNLFSEINDLGLGALSNRPVGGGAYKYETKATKCKSRATRKMSFLCRRARWRFLGCDWEGAWAGFLFRNVLIFMQNQGDQRFQPASKCQMLFAQFTARWD